MLRKGYRCDSLYGSGITDAITIIKYETEEMRNSDILDYCSEKYGIEKSIGSLILFLIDKFDTSELNALWLCDNITDVLNSYIENEVNSYLSHIDDDSALTYNITAYRIPENAIIVSDLNEGGKLYVSDAKFEPIAFVEYKYYKDGTVSSSTINAITNFHE